jgi:hypothetical protein
MNGHMHYPRAIATAALVASYVPVLRVGWACFGCAVFHIRASHTNFLLHIALRLYICICRAALRFYGAQTLLATPTSLLAATRNLGRVCRMLQMALVCLPTAMAFVPYGFVLVRVRVRVRVGFCLGPKEKKQKPALSCDSIQGISKIYRLYVL